MRRALLWVLLWGVCRAPAAADVPCARSVAWMRLQISAPACMHALVSSLPVPQDAKKVAAAAAAAVAEGKEAAANGKQEEGGKKKEDANGSS